MIKYPKNVCADQYGKEILEKELFANGFLVYAGNIYDFITKKVEPHWHEELEIFILDKGTVEVHLDGQMFVLNEGDGYFSNSNHLHSLIPKGDEECLYRSFVFDKNFIIGTIGSVFDLKYISPIVENGKSCIFEKNDNHQFYELFEKAFLVCENEKDGFEFELRHLLSNILLLVKNKLFSSIEKNKKMYLNDRIKPMILWIDNNLENDICVEDIAEQVNLCVRECQRIFNQSINDSPMGYVRKRRVIHSLNLLTKTNLSVVDIALRLQFSSSSHYSKVFKEIIGCTPSQYRNRSKKSTNN